MVSLGRKKRFASPKKFIYLKFEILVALQTTALGMCQYVAMLGS